MKIIDRYFIKELFIPIALCSAALIFLVFMADLFDNLDVMLKNKTPFSFILRYYAALVPSTFVSTISWASLLGTIYVLTAFNYHNEITAMKVAGLEIVSIIRPVIFAGFVVGVLSFLVNEQMAPQASRAAREILKERIEMRMEPPPPTGEKPEQKKFENVTYYGGKDRLYYARSFHPEEQKLEDFIILWLDAKRNVRKKTVVREAVWTGVEWELKQVTDYSMERSGEMIGEPEFRQTAILAELTETPEEFRNAANEDSFVSYRELKEYIEKLQENGIKLQTEPVELNYKLAYPWHALVVMFLSVPLLAKTTTRRLIAVNVLACLACVFFFHVAGAVILALGKAGKLPPLVSAWSQNFLFSFAALYFLDRANH